MSFVLVEETRGNWPPDEAADGEIALRGAM